MLDYILEDFQKGGWVILPIVLVSLWGWILISTSFMTLFAQGGLLKHLRKRIRYPRTLVKWLKTEITEKERLSIPGRVLSKVYKVRYKGESAMLEVLDEELKFCLPELEKGLPTLGVLAGAAPLLGLLGTVSGMVGTFEVISVFGTSNPALMADSIAEALVTTQNGLIAAVPLMLVHIFLANRADKVETETVKAAHRLINYYRLKPKKD